MTITDTPVVHQCGDLAVTLASATRIGGRASNADAASTEGNPLGIGAAVIDGIGSSSAVVAAARRAADTAAVVASHRGAQAGIMAAADTMPDHPKAPNAVGAVVSIEPGGRIEIAHVGDCAVWTWSRSAGLRRWTVDETAGQHVAHMLRNPGLTRTDRAVLQQHGNDVVAALGDYVLNGLVYASISTISWTPLRGEHAEVDLIMLASDGVHKPVAAQQIAQLAEQHASDARALADALVDTAVTVPRTHTDEDVDNATAAVISLTRTAVTR